MSFRGNEFQDRETEETSKYPVHGNWIQELGKRIPETTIL